MWPWRRRSPMEKLDLPRRCFISHSYKDATAREHLLSLLPPSVEPIIFPPITVQPDQMVSNHLIESILDCDAVICLRGGASDESFWVAFERDYAIRAGKRVFSFDPRQGALAPDTSKALKLAIFPIWGWYDKERVLRSVEFMRD